MKGAVRAPGVLSPRLLIPLWCLALAALRVGTDNETDAFWTAREGLDLMAGGALIHPDRWSWAPVPGDFVPNSPAWQWFLGLAWRAAGRSGLMLVSFISIALCLHAMARLARRLGAGQLGTAMGLVVLVIVDGPLFVNRSALPAFVLLLVALDRLWRHKARLARAHGLTSACIGFTVSLALVSAGLWLHTSWALWSVAWLVDAALFSALAWPGRLARQLSFAGSALLGCGLAIAIGPLGLQIFAQSERVAHATQGINLEWASPVEQGVRWTLVCAFAVAMGVVASVNSWRRRPIDEVWVVRLVLSMGLLGGALAGAFAIRFLLLGLLCGMPVITAQFASWGPRWTGSAVARRLGERATARYWSILMMVAGLIVLPLGIARSALLAYPSLSDPSISSLPRDCSLFADDSSAAILLRPDVRIWWDGRQDYWGRTRFIDGIRFLQGSERNDLVPAGTTCVLLHNIASGPKWTHLAAGLDADPRWKTVAANAYSQAWTLAIAR